MTQDWQNNTVAELTHGPCDGAELIISKGLNVVTITVPAHDGQERVYDRDSATLRFHAGAPATVKFRYQQTRKDKEPVE